MDSDLTGGTEQIDAFGRFESEIAEVEELMHQTLAQLASPLQELVQARIRAAQPRYRAAIVLTAGYEGGDNAQDRVYLAAALEMLYVALDIHRMLVEASAAGERETDVLERRSRMGGTILAGDFCFSHAAQMAAKTNNPVIVTLFAQALQEVSAEELQRLQLGADHGVQDGGSDSVLLRSGVLAALELSRFCARERSNAMALVELAIEAIVTSNRNPVAGGAGIRLTGASEWDEGLKRLSNDVRPRWQAFQRWLENPP